MLWGNVVNRENISNLMSDKEDVNRTDAVKVDVGKSSRILWSSHHLQT